MIRSFKTSVAESVFNGRCPRGFPAKLLSAARRKLRLVHNAVDMNDLRSPPGNKLHALLKDRAGQHAIWINDQYRICFRWTELGAEDVEIVDYHD